MKPDGSLKWSFPTANIITASPAIGPDGTVYIVSGDYKLYAIKPDGKQKWASSIARESSPAIGGAAFIWVARVALSLPSIMWMVP